jgi:N-acetylneuraminic acid mutarotase
VIVFGGARSNETSNGPQFSTTLYQYDSNYNNKSNQLGERTIEVTVDTSSIQPRNFHSAVYHANTLYIFGGKSNGYQNDLHGYDLTTKTWRKVTYPSKEHVPTPR